MARTELETYEKKRDFSRTPEPAGEREGSPGGELVFVVQKHDATRLHYDFRLEWDGVLLSWAVPKGPVPDPEVKRLAMRTEDHPYSYRGFEGVIPEGQYGGGTVMVWDRGRWEPEGDPGRGLAEGRLDFTLHGEKLRGRWTLVRSESRSEREAKESWLLFKRNDAHARPGSGTALLEEKRLSVATGRSMAEIARDRRRVWSSSEEGGGAEAAAPAAGRLDPSGVPKAKKAALPETADPQLATLGKTAPGGEGWFHEIKLDGYRLLCRVRAERGGDRRSVRLLTRRGKDWTDRFVRVARAASALPVSSALLDGEAVVLDRKGRSDFQALQNALGRYGHGGGAPTDLLYYAFDLLHLDGFDLTRSPIEERKAMLEELLRDAPGVLRYSEHLVGGGAAIHREACRLGLEGIISKRAGSPYTPGRGRDWRKTKCLRRQEMVIVGWTEPGGSRAELGSLVLGVHDREGNLVYAGRVGTGFTQRTLRDLRRRLDPLARKTPPVRNAPRSARGKEIHWVRPELVAEVTFTEWTADGAIRHPSFQGLREDKPASEVVREEPAEAPPADEERRGKARGAARSAAASGAVRIGGVVFTSPDRVLYPGAGVTKADVGRYWEAVAEHALPLLAERPLTLYRCPEGIGGECFFQKHAHESVPEAVRRVTVPEKSGDPKPEPYMFVDGLPALLTLVQLGVLELHVWGARADRPSRPDRVVMDLDPGPGVEWGEIVRAALALRAMLSELGLRSWPRATGGKGLHVVIPLVRRHSWDEVRSFSRALSELMAAGAPERFVSRAGKGLREGKIYVDWLRNGRNATAVATFSPRARPGAPVSFPLSWDEVEETDGPPLLPVPEAAEIDWAARAPWKGFADARQSITQPMRRALGIG